jgi:tricorn protease-like protein
MSVLRKVLAMWIVLGACLAFAQDMQEGRLMRFPDIYKDKIAFSYGGDIWLGSTSGGIAHRITSHPGRELFPKFSPDGKWIAFTGQYDGNFNVYVMPAEGGQPKQLTFYQGSAQPLSDRMGIHNEVVNWYPDGKRILFISRANATNGWVKRQFSVSVADLPQFPHLEALHRRHGTGHPYLRPQEQHRRSRTAAHRLDRHLPHVARQHHLLQFRPRT